MSKRMKTMLEFFTDVLIIDGSHKTNRFGLPFLDIVLVNNYGQTSTCFVALVEDQTYESFLWAINHFKSQLKTMPKVFF